MDGGGQRGFMNGTGLVKFVIDALFFFGERGVVKIQHHQHVRLLDHVRAVNAVIAPMLIQRELGDGDGVYVRVGQVEIPVVLLDQPRFVLRDIHVFGDFPPAGDFLFPQRCFFHEGGPGVRLVPPHVVQRLGGAKQDAHTHVIGVSVVVHHHVELIRPHDAKKPVFPRLSAFFHTAG